MRIIVIDDDPLVRESLKIILQAKGMEVLAIGDNGETAFLLYEQFKPDIMLMDIRMEQVNGLEATRNILSRYPQAKILLITTFQDEEYIHEAIGLGCRGYILKQNIEGIIPAIEAVASEQLVFDSKIVKQLSSNHKKYLSDDLSPREKDILLLVASGYNNKEIADKLFLSEGTIRNYISAMLEKLGLRDRTQLAIYYYNPNETLN